MFLILCISILQTVFHGKRERNKTCKDGKFCFAAGKPGTRNIFLKKVPMLTCAK